LERKVCIGLNMQLFVEIKHLKKHSVGELKNFGFIFSGIFLIIAVFGLLNGQNYGQIFIVLSLLVGLVTLIFPFLLSSFYIFWMSFGLIMGWIVSTFVLTVIFFVVFTATRILTKIFKVKFVQTELSRNVGTYWLVNKKIIDKAQYSKQY
jgi:hypothetical protein